MEIEEFLKTTLGPLLAPTLFVCPMAVSEIEGERKEKEWRRREGRERKEEEGGGFVLAFMHWASRFRLQVSNRKTAIVVGSYLPPHQ